MAKTIHGYSKGVLENADLSSGQHADGDDGHAAGAVQHPSAAAQGLVPSNGFLWSRRLLGPCLLAGGWWGK